MESNDWRVLLGMAMGLARSQGEMEELRKFVGVVPSAASAAASPAPTLAGRKGKHPDKTKKKEDDDPRWRITCPVCPEPTTLHIHSVHKHYLTQKHFLKDEHGRVVTENQKPVLIPRPALIRRLSTEYSRYTRAKAKNTLAVEVEHHNARVVSVSLDDDDDDDPPVESLPPEEVKTDENSEPDSDAEYAEAQQADGETGEEIEEPGGNRRVRAQVPTERVREELAQPFINYLKSPDGGGVGDTSVYVRMYTRLLRFKVPAHVSDEVCLQQQDEFEGGFCDLKRMREYFHNLENVWLCVPGTMGAYLTSVRAIFR